MNVLIWRGGETDGERDTEIQMVQYIYGLMDELED